MSQSGRAEKRIRNSRNELREMKVCHPHDRYGRNLIEEKRVHSRAQRRLGRVICGSEQDDEDTYRDRADGLSSEDY